MAEACSENGVWGCKKIPYFLSLTSWGREIPGWYLRESAKNSTKDIKYQFPAHELPHPKNEEYPYLSTWVWARAVARGHLHEVVPPPHFYFLFQFFNNKFQIDKLEIPANRVKKEE